MMAKKLQPGLKNEPIYFSLLRKVMHGRKLLWHHLMNLSLSDFDKVCSQFIALKCPQSDI